MISHVAEIAEQPALQQPPAALSKDDVIRIWTAIADQRYPVYLSAQDSESPSAQVRRKPVMLLDRSTQTCAGDSAQQVCGSNLDQKLLSSAAADAFVSRQARQTLLLANMAQVDVRLPDSVYIRTASTAQVDALLVDINWSNFYKAFPGTAGYLRISVPVPVDGGSRSLVYAEQRCHGRCGTGMLYLLTRAGNGWTITNRLELWVT
ncbi:hypothetical protein [Xanthomonas cannabis]|uniref:hypothetical protein n=1 Tax=Xanthomonas cannabis TaxID=1885674 RepID=UPI0011121072|nr:hypothetical protein [Xanthomonas cannabis]MCC8442010.1 hypothetical protein [Xanthomonas cannabis]